MSGAVGIQDARYPECPVSRSLLEGTRRLPCYQGMGHGNGQGHGDGGEVGAHVDGLQQTGCKQGKRDDGKTRAWIGIRFKTPDDDQDNGTRQDIKC